MHKDSVIAAKFLNYEKANRAQRGNCFLEQDIETIQDILNSSSVTTPISTGSSTNGGGSYSPGARLSPMPNEWAGMLPLYPDPPAAELKENRNKAEAIIAKQRNGPTGSLDLLFLKDWTRFENPEFHRGME